MSEVDQDVVKDETKTAEPEKTGDAGTQDAPAEGASGEGASESTESTEGK